MFRAPAPSDVEVAPGHLLAVTIRLRSSRRGQILVLVLLVLAVGFYTVAVFGN